MQELSSLMAELSGVDLLEATRTDERSTREELRCVLAVVRHGDRTPKQKLKVKAHPSGVHVACNLPQLCRVSHAACCS
jgi:hypothetical protein